MHLTRAALAALAALTLATEVASAATSVRWTGAEDQDADFAHVLTELQQRTGLVLKDADFKLNEDRDLAFTHYRRFDQVLQDVGIKDMAVRIWTDRTTGRLVQLEAVLEEPGKEPRGVVAMESATGRVREAAALALAHKRLRGRQDGKVRAASVDRFWDKGRLVLRVRMKAHRGTHHVAIDAMTLDVLQDSYVPFEQADLGGGGQGGGLDGEFSVPAQIYPFYEEYEGAILPRIATRLKHLQRQVALPDSDPFAPLRSRHYFLEKEDSVLGATPDGQAQGFWSMELLKGQVSAIQAALPKTANSFKNGGVFLQGKYATVSIYPEAFTTFPGVTLPKRLSPELIYEWKEDATVNDYEIVPTSALLGNPLSSWHDAWTRPATRDPEHNPAVYMNEGYDEVQVYYAVNQLFESLKPMGFTDPDLSERPFNAFLFDPDIESRDNAYYTDDTINFTTYSPEHLNMARDNTTIWHELGHGVMDRLMGSRLQLADTGGLSEGMADFVAQLVLGATAFQQDFPGSEDMRIVNRTGFFLTNEVHDDGEAYGGTMKDFLDLAVQKYGRDGLTKVTDVVLEAMRLCRDHPGLTAQDWFDHLVFADSLGRGTLRAPGELKPLIEQALNARNFAAEADRALYSLSYQGQEVVAGTLGSRGNELPLKLAPDATTTQEIKVKIADGASYKFTWPVEVRVYYKSGPLQGAVHWEGEENEPEVHVLNSPGDELTLALKARGTCDYVNTQDGACSDFAYVQIWNKDGTKPVAKKRFYLKITTETPDSGS